jgi:hypothetical protein
VKSARRDGAGGDGEHGGTVEDRQKRLYVRITEKSPEASTKAADGRGQRQLGTD